MPNLIRLTNIIYDNEWSEEKKKLVPKNTESDIYINPYSIVSIGMSDAYNIDNEGENTFTAHVTVFCERERQYYVKEDLDTVISLFNQAM